MPDGDRRRLGAGYLALTGSYLTQTIEGLEKLLQMPFGCGEQNMILFAPDVFVTRYLKETGQLKPEIMAKAENLMITGYQRELTYRRNDGSFSAFGNQDKDGSLWLTAFVLKTFAQAKDSSTSTTRCSPAPRPGSPSTRRPTAPSSRWASSTTRRCWAG